MEICGISPVYKVGGCVRDKIMGRVPNDIDYTTPMTPDEMTAIIQEQDKRVYAMGARFGTIAFKHNGEMIEITTFRSEVYDGQSRKPTVEFVKNLQDDLSRRDFTINAIAEDENGFIDPFGGFDDIVNHLVRAVGNADKRFRDDPLRLLRAIRFAANFGFSIESKTWIAIRDRPDRILRVSKERWDMELTKMMHGNDPVAAMGGLMRSGLFNFICPELSLQYEYDQNNIHHRYDLWNHTLNVLQAYQKSNKFVMDTPEHALNMKWAIVLHDVGKPFVRRDLKDRSIYPAHASVSAEIAESFAIKMKWSNDRRKEVVDLVLHHMDDDSYLAEFDRGGK